MDKKKQLKLPSNLLGHLGDSIDDKQWRETHNLGGKRKSRKESRKEQRQAKKRKPTHGAAQQAPVEPTPKAAEKAPKQKQKKQEAKKEKKPAKSDAIVRPFLSAHDEEVRQKDEDDANYYAKKLGLKSLKLNKENDGLDDILGDLDFDNFGGDSENESNNDESNNDSENESQSDSENDFQSDSENDFENSQSDDSGSEMTAEETMRKLAELKRQKNKSNSKEENIRTVKQDELSSDDSGSDDSGSDDNDEGDFPSDDSLSEGDFDESEDEDEDDDDEGGEMTAEETMKKLAALKAKKNGASQGAAKPTATKNEIPSDDSLSEGDFDSDEDESEEDEEEGGMTAEETMKRLAALKAQKRQGSASSSSNGKAKPSEEEPESSDEFGSESENTSDSDSEDEDENPYVPPTRRGAPAAAPEVKQDSEAVQRMRRAFKGSLNKLTESTLPHVSQEIQLVFLKNSRAEASEVFTDELLNLVNTPQPLQQVLYTVYAGLVANLYLSVGLTFAAHFVQVLVELIFAPRTTANKSNLTNLLVELYSFHIVSSRLIYDFMKRMLTDISSTESLSEVELLLIVIRSGGNQLRSDDPVALKEVIVLLQRKMQDLGGNQALTPRMRFLVDSVVALKNNRQKPLSELVVSARHRIRKALQSAAGSGSSGGLKDPMQVGLSDILDSQTRGKWWLVGASWKGNSGSSSSSGANGQSGGDDKFDFDLDDEFGSSAVDWLELAKKQRLNTDIRRAVFVALMGAEDYLDACLRIDKLGLKTKQERDIPHVILHCLVQEPAYNPYYMLVATKQCMRHSTMKTFQFRLWDWLHSDPSGHPQQALHYGRFYANLVSQKAMSLDVLKQADFIGASSDTELFLDMFFVTLYKDMAKVAEKEAKSGSHHRGLATIYSRLDSSSEERDGKDLAMMLKKVQDPKVLRGIQIVNKRINRSEILRTEKERERVRWASQFTNDLIDELVRQKD